MVQDCSQTKTFLLYHDRNCLSVFRVLIGLTRWIAKKRQNKNTSKRNENIMGVYQSGRNAGKFGARIGARDVVDSLLFIHLRTCQSSKISNPFEIEVLSN